MSDRNQKGFELKGWHIILLCVAFLATVGLILASNAMFTGRYSLVAWPGFEKVVHLI